MQERAVARRKAFPYVLFFIIAVAVLSAVILDQNRTIGRMKGEIDTLEMEKECREIQTHGKERQKDEKKREAEEWNCPVSEPYLYSTVSSRLRYSVCLGEGAQPSASYPKGIRSTGWMFEGSSNSFISASGS